METRDARLKRFLLNGVHEIPLTLLNSINTFWIPQLKTADQHKLDGLVFMGTHAVMQTLGKHVFGKSGIAATTFYLQHFVDGERADLRFSQIAGPLHDMRNVLAHQWFSSQAHEFIIDYRGEKGWWKSDEGTHINPSVYLGSFLSRFPGTRPETRYENHVSEDDLKTRKYEFIAEWLALSPKHPIRKKITGMNALSGNELLKREKEIQDELTRELGSSPAN